MFFTILLLSLVLPSLTDAAGDARFAPKQDSESSENLVQTLPEAQRTQGQPDRFFPVFFLCLPEVEMLPMRDGTNEQQAKIELLSF